MKTVLGTLFGVIAMAALLQVSAMAAEEIFCGRILGYSAATATAHGSFVIAERGPQTLVGTYIVIPRGTTQFDTQGTAWVCVRTTDVPPTPVADNQTSTRAFVAFVAPGSPGYRAEPTAAPTPAGPRAVGSLPGTATAPATGALAPLALGVPGLIALGAFALRQGRPIR